MIPQFQSQSGLQFISSLNPAAWYRYGIGITSAATLVSAWADQSGNSRTLLQAIGTNQPTLTADNSVLFDGVDNFLQAVAFTFSQPLTGYLLLKHVTWVNDTYIVDGDTAASGSLLHSGTTPQVKLYAGALAATNSDLAVNTYGVMAYVLNGASSLIQVNNGTPTTGNPGAFNPGGITIGANGDAGAGDFANIQVKEAIFFAAAHDATTRNKVTQYLQQVGGL